MSTAVIPFRRRERVVITPARDPAGAEVWCVEAHLPNGAEFILDMAPSLRRAREVARDWDPRGRIEVRQ